MDDGARRRRRKDSHNVRRQVSGQTPKKRRKQRRRRSRTHSPDPPFGILVLQVGATLFIVCAVIFSVSMYMWPSSSQEDEEEEEEEEILDDDFQDFEVNQQQQQEDEVVEGFVATEPPEPETPPPLPHWELSKASKFDAYGLAESYGNENDEFWQLAFSIRSEFSELYGGENAARAILERGLSVFGEGSSTLEHTACRIRDAKEAGRNFSFAYGGYSVTVGRGNYFSQSFPFVMERILKKPFEVLGIPLVVKNAAIGGIPSFPYGWCMENFWGPNPDVVSWDYSMNEAGGVPAGLEAYLRYTLRLSRRPKLIVKDTHMAEARRSILQHYVDRGLALDPIVLHTDPAAAPFLTIQEDFRPDGFKEWRTFGAPPGAPGQVLHHPAKKEHEFVAWLIAMHFLAALELVAADRSNSFLKCSNFSLERPLPSPFAIHPQNLTMKWASLLFGSQVGSSDDWTLNPVRCRTSYEPLVGGNLESTVVSGTFGDGTDIMMPKGAMYYTKGWVLDLSDGEKLAKRKLNRYNGLGFIDSKKAYYGIYASGTLCLFLSYESESKSIMPTVGAFAREWISSVVVCEVNEQRQGRVCDMHNDVSYKLGGVNVNETEKIDAAGSLYYGRSLCTYMRVPEAATLTSRRKLVRSTGKQDAGGGLRATAPVVEALSASQEADSIGISLELTVTDMHIMKKEVACSVSHVVWEQRAADRSSDNH